MLYSRKNIYIEINDKKEYFHDDLHLKKFHLPNSNSSAPPQWPLEAISHRIGVLFCFIMIIFSAQEIVSAHNRLQDPFLSKITEFDMLKALTIFSNFSNDEKLRNLHLEI